MTQKEHTELIEELISDAIDVEADVIAETVYAWIYDELFCYNCAENVSYEVVSEAREIVFDKYTEILRPLYQLSVTTSEAEIKKQIQSLIKEHLEDVTHRCGVPVRNTVEWYEMSEAEQKHAWVVAAIKGRRLFNQEYDPPQTSSE